MLNHVTQHYECGGSIDECHAVLNENPLYGRMKYGVIENILRAAHVENVDRGDSIFLQGEPVTRCFVVLEGWVKICRVTNTGDEVLVAMLTRAQSFAEDAAFMEGTYPVSAEAVTKARLLCIPTRTLISQIREEPEVGLATLASISEQLHGLVREIEQLKARTGVERVAEFLASLCGTRKGACKIDLPYDKVLIAARLGMKPETLSRAFAKLRQIGVHMEEGTAEIMDVSCLRQYVLAGRAMGEGSRL